MNSESVTKPQVTGTIISACTNIADNMTVEFKVTWVTHYLDFQVKWQC